MTILFQRPNQFAVVHVDCEQNSHVKAQNVDSNLCVTLMEDPYEFPGGTHQQIVDLTLLCHECEERRLSTWAQLSEIKDVVDMADGIFQQLELLHSHRGISALRALGRLASEKGAAALTRAGALTVLRRDQVSEAAAQILMIQSSESSKILVDTANVANFTWRQKRVMSSSSSFF